MRNLGEKLRRRSVLGVALLAMTGLSLDVQTATFSETCYGLTGNGGVEWSVLVPGRFVNAAEHGAPFAIQATGTYLSHGSAVDVELGPLPLSTNLYRSEIIDGDYLFRFRSCIDVGPQMDIGAPVEVTARLEARPGND